MSNRPRPYRVIYCESKKEEPRQYKYGNCGSALSSPGPRSRSRSSSDCSNSRSGPNSVREVGYQPYYSDPKREAERIARESAPRYEPAQRPAQASNQAQAQHSGRERSEKNVVHNHFHYHQHLHLPQPFLTKESQEESDKMLISPIHVYQNQKYE
jgi:hypothetical protein